MAVEIDAGINVFRVEVDKDSSEDVAIAAALVGKSYYRYDFQNGRVFFSFLEDAESVVAAALGREDLRS